MDWNNELVMKFLELYQNEPSIWDPKHPLHKNKMKVHDAWGRMSTNLNKIPISELKAKKNSLMAIFRTYRRKKEASTRTGAGTDDIYQQYGWPMQ